MYHWTSKIIISGSVEIPRKKRLDEKIRKKHLSRFLTYIGIMIFVFEVGLKKVSGAGKDGETIQIKNYDNAYDVREWFIVIYFHSKLVQGEKVTAT